MGMSGKGSSSSFYSPNATVTAVSSGGLRMGTPYGTYGNVVMTSTGRFRATVASTAPIADGLDVQTRCTLCGNMHHPLMPCPEIDRPTFTLQDLEEAEKTITELSDRTK